MNMDQTIIDRAVNIATKAALNNCPVERIVWISPQKATDDPGGYFAIKYVGDLKATDTPPWER